MSNGFQISLTSDELVGAVGEFKPLNASLTDVASAGAFSGGFSLEEGEAGDKIQYVPVLGGITKAILGETVTMSSNRELSVGANGKLVNSSIGDQIVAIAFQSGVLDDEILVLPCNYVKQAATLSTFEDLSDTGAYAGNGLKLLRVNSTHDAVEYVDGTTLYAPKYIHVRLSRTGAATSWTAEIDDDSAVSNAGVTTNTINLVLDSSVIDPANDTTIIQVLRTGYKTAAGDIVWGQIHDGTSVVNAVSVQGAWDISSDQLDIDVLDESGTAVTINEDVSTNINYVELILIDIS